MATRASPGLVVLLGALSALAPLSVDMNLPALPRLTAVFATSADRVQLTLSVFLVGFAAGQLVHGPASDRFGRRPVLLAGLALFAAAGFACAASRSIGWLIAGRLLQGLGACAGPVVARAIVRDLFQGAAAARLMSWIALVQGLGPLLAPLVGGYLLLLFGWPSIFVAQGGAAVVLLGVTWRRLAESLARRDPEAISPAGLGRAYARFFASPAAVRHAAVIAGAFAGMFAYISGSPFVLIQVFGVPSERYGWYFALTALSLMAGALTNGRLVRRVAPEALLRAGLALVVAGGAAMAACALAGAGGVAGVVAPMMVYVFGYGLVVPNATAGALEPHGRIAGVVSAVLGGVQMAAGAAAGYAVNALYARTPLAMAGFVAAMGAAAAVVYLAGARERRRPRFPVA
jgi:DHA1 family bicyclomycin/chloramphenicol resistance-like MFS transporter